MAKKLANPFHRPTSRRHVNCRSVSNRVGRNPFQPRLLYSRVEAGLDALDRLPGPFDDILGLSGLTGLLKGCAGHRVDWNDSPTLTRTNIGWPKVDLVSLKIHPIPSQFEDRAD